MVYRGKPSAGCENCRKAKKRCTLEQPACTRCVKLKKECVGYRDTSQLQIQDETQSVLQKIGRRKTSQSASQSQFSIISPNVKPVDKRAGPVWSVSDFNTVPTTTQPSRQTSQLDPILTRYDTINPGLSPSFSATPSIGSDSSSSIKEHIDSAVQQMSVVPELKDLNTGGYGSSAYAVNFNLSNVFTLIQWASGIPKSPKPIPDDVAIKYFLNTCTADTWGTYFRDPSFNQRRDQCLDLAIKACGMAALNNVRPVPAGAEWSRNMYAEAIRLLNAALKDPEQCRTDESLVAVTMLGFYENLVCHNIQSVQAWKAHIKGATQLLRLRGRSQFNTMTGRQLFRELRGQIIISCIWDNEDAPAFLNDWQPDLIAKSTSLQFITPIDKLATISTEFTSVRSKWKQRKIPGREALDMVNQVDADLIQWAIDAPQADHRWQFNELQVDDGPHVWNGMLHAYSGLPVPSTWNMYRSMRILVSRTNELMARDFFKTPEDERTQITYFRTVRRQMTDEICAGIPCSLGHAAPAFSSPCVLVSAYGSIWPIFFATTCALERLGLNIWEQGDLSGDITTASAGHAAGTFSSAAQQAAWLLGRLDYISGTIGLKWADGIAGSLREAIDVQKKKFFAAQAGGSVAPEYLQIAGEIVQGVMAWRQQAKGG